jgi:hypothetical protein
MLVLGEAVQQKLESKFDDMPTSKIFKSHLLGFISFVDKMLNRIKRWKKS